MTYARLSLVAGFAMFSMFFGSGNLVFPIMLGVLTESQFGLASVGLILTGVIVPFLGLLAMIYARGDIKVFFKSLGAPITFLLIFAMLSLLGPFGVVPRCIIVAQGGVDLIAPTLRPEVFNALFCTATAFLAWQRARIIDVIGTFLTPLLLIGLVALIACGLFMGGTPSQSIAPPEKAFFSGVIQGYQTMDLLAAFFFSATTVAFISSALGNPKDQKNLESLSLTACLIGALLLTGIYLGFAYLGAQYSVHLQGTPPEKLLVHIAHLSLGSFALPIAAIIITLACLTTAAILSSLFADFLYQELFKERFSRKFSLIVTLGISYAFSLLGFQDLAGWIGNALTIVYPALIAYTLCMIFANKTTVNVSFYAFWFVLLGSILIKFSLGFLIT